MEGEPPKLWLAWIYRSASGEPHWTKKWLEKLFGKNFQVNLFCFYNIVVKIRFFVNFLKDVLCL